MTQKKWILQFLNKHRGDIIIGSLGSISKNLEELDNGKNILFFIKGAMGCAMGVGLGIALNTKKKVYVIIGDGSFLMKMGSMATIMRYKLKNLKVIILNNNCHASCGGQPTNFHYIKKYIPFKIVNINAEIHSG